MRFFVENKLLLLKYLCILISNICLLIFSNYYFEKLYYKDILLLFLVLIVDLIIYFYKERQEFKLYLDFILSLLLGLILIFFIKDEEVFGKCLISIIFANNIVFTRSRLNSNFIKRSLQYISTVILMLIEVFINLALYILIW